VRGGADVDTHARAGGAGWLGGARARAAARAAAAAADQPTAASCAAVAAARPLPRRSEALHAPPLGSPVRALQPRARLVVERLLRPRLRLHKVRVDEALGGGSRGGSGGGGFLGMCRDRPLARLRGGARRAARGARLPPADTRPLAPSPCRQPGAPAPPLTRPQLVAAVRGDRGVQPPAPVAERGERLDGARDVAGGAGAGARGGGG
jgi:hypothetical protein